jgi:hypothetical protein
MYKTFLKNRRIRYAFQKIRSRSVNIIPEAPPRICIKAGWPRRHLPSG